MEKIATKWVVYFLIVSSPLKAQFLQKVTDVKPILPMYASQTEVKFAHFLTNNRLVVCSVGADGKNSYTINQLNGSELLVVKDITSEFSSQKNGVIDLTFQPVQGKDFFYARKIPFGIVKAINSVGEVLQTFEVSYAYYLSTKTEEERKKIRDRKEKPYSNLTNTGKPTFGQYNLIIPGSTNQEVYGIDYGNGFDFPKLTDINRLSDSKLKLKKGEIEPVYAIQVKDAGTPWYETPTYHLEESFKEYYPWDLDVDVNQKCRYRLGKVYYPNRFIPLKKSAFTKIEAGKEAFFDRGLDVETTTFCIDYKKNLAYVGYNDGVIDAYDLTIDKSPILTRVNRIYSSPLNTFIKIASCDKFIVVAENLTNKKTTTDALTDLYVWQITGNKLVYSLLGEVVDPKYPNFRTPLYEETGAANVVNMEFSPDGKYVMVVGRVLYNVPNENKYLKKIQMKIWELK